jgi:hypothetical protein
VAAIRGTLRGLSGIDYEKWRRPINDFLTCSSVVGSLNIQDIPYGAGYIAKLAWALAGEDLPEPWKTIIDKRIDSCHFEYPGSTHAIRVRTENPGAGYAAAPEVELLNTDETANSGSRSLKVHVMPLEPGSRVYVFKKTHYTSKDYHDSRYDPSFSPLLYPGQTVHGAAFLPDYGSDCVAGMYVHNADTGEIIEGEKQTLKKGTWTALSLKIPPIKAGLIDEAGFVFDMQDLKRRQADLTCMVDDLYFDGTPDYTIDFSRIREDVWTGLHREITQFTRLKGLWYLEDNQAHLSCGDFGEVYTGRHDWKDYRAVFTIQPRAGNDHLVNVRVQGAIRSYAAGLTAGGRLGLYKNENGYRRLAETDFAWEAGKWYAVAVTVSGHCIKVEVQAEAGGAEKPDRACLDYTDTDAPYLSGGIGLSVRNGSRCAYSSIVIGPPLNY